MREKRYWGRGRKQHFSELVFRVLGSLGKFSTSLKDTWNEAESNTAHLLAKTLHPLPSSTGLNLANCLCDLMIKRKHNSPPETHRINWYFTRGRGGVMLALSISLSPETRTDGFSSPSSGSLSYKEVFPFPTQNSVFF